MSSHRDRDSHRRPAERDRDRDRDGHRDRDRDRDREHRREREREPSRREYGHGARGDERRPPPPGREAARDPAPQEPAPQMQPPPVAAEPLPGAPAMPPPPPVKKAEPEIDRTKASTRRFPHICIGWLQMQLKFDDARMWPASDAMRWRGLHHPAPADCNSARARVHSRIPGSSTADSCLGALAWLCVLTASDMLNLLHKPPLLPCFCLRSDGLPDSRQKNCTC